MYVPKTKTEPSSNFLQDGANEVKGNQHFGSPKHKDGKKNGLKCFKCDRYDHLANACTFEKKEDGTDVNTKEEIDKKYEERVEARKARWAAKASRNNTAGGSQHFVGSAVIESDTSSDSDSIPNFEEAILEEEEYDGQTYTQTFMIDLRNTNHVFNQTGNHKSMMLYDMLCDNQSTCDVIVNP